MSVQEAWAAVRLRRSGPRVTFGQRPDDLTAGCPSPDDVVDGSDPLTIERLCRRPIAQDDGRDGTDA
jgi:hypothetical protein